MTHARTLLALLLTTLFILLTPAAQADTFKVGEEVFASRSARWKVGRIVKAEDTRYYIQFKGYSKPDWIEAEKVKPAKKVGPWLVGDFVAIPEPNGVLYRGTITEKRGDDEFQILYIWDKSKAWVSGDQIRPAASAADD